ncbi:hypothetical protein BZA05DRAFT_411255 [Tricharina praecox]|uniref:uncharacterized protein n=1 Tax=Tricharina praecox TaxID=43433 RepID=UPI00221E5560|nr:uncharacterized protein BZA05DRAFT_411255 [Tricharina praecox]KAI5843148.1 hypothetical protein BZA05DRAFT_411255 [Tricharina praecox]
MPTPPPPPRGLLVHSWCVGSTLFDFPCSESLVAPLHGTEYVLYNSSTRPCHWGTMCNRGSERWLDAASLAGKRIGNSGLSCCAFPRGPWARRTSRVESSPSLGHGAGVDPLERYPARGTCYIGRSAWECSNRREHRGDRGDPKGRMRRTRSNNESNNNGDNNCNNNHGNNNNNNARRENYTLISRDDIPQPQPADLQVTNFSLTHHYRVHASHRLRCGLIPRIWGWPRFSRYTPCHCTSQP